MAAEIGLSVCVDVGAYEPDKAVGPTQRLSVPVLAACGSVWHDNVLKTPCDSHHLENGACDVLVDISLTNSCLSFAYRVSAQSSSSTLSSSHTCLQEIEHVASSSSSSKKPYWPFSVFSLQLYVQSSLLNTDPLQFISVITAAHWLFFPLFSPTFSENHGCHHR